MEIINILLSVVLFVLAIVLFCGKGTFLIAGFNSNESEQKEYDEKKLGIVVGATMLILGIAELLMGIFPIKNVVIPCFVVIILAIAIMVLLIYKKCKINKNIRNEE